VSVERNSTTLAAIGSAEVIQEVEALSAQERVEYWASRTPQERMAAGWEMTKEHCRKLRLWHEGMQMDKSAFRIMRHRDLRSDDEVASRK
jgi:hypothetical protein